MGLSRRDFVFLGAGAAAGGAGAYWLRGRRTVRLAPGAGSPDSVAPVRATIAQRYGHGPMPPAELGPLALEGRTVVPELPRGHGPRRYALDVVDQRVMVSQDHGFDAWTFGGSVPGPILRAREGERIEVEIRNQTTSPHNLHFHGRHEILADGWEPVPPGGSASYAFTAGPFGVHPYHCDMTPVGDHIGNGLFGMFIVDPPGGRPPAREIALVLSGFDVNGDGKSEVYAWNGVAGFYAKYPIKVPVGELVRVYLLNMATAEPAASFHLHAETFAVYRSGTSLTPDERTDIVTLAPTERAILEFRLPQRGRYMFHPHQARMAELGAMGWFAAV